MSSTIVFDITRTEWLSNMNWTPFAFVAVLGGIKVVTYLLSRRKGSKIPSGSMYSGKLNRFMPFVLVAFCLTMLAVTARKTYVDYAELRSAYENGQCEVVEGTVENFQATKNARNLPRESFDIGVKHFTYPVPGNTAGFKTTEADGGPMKNGLRARIHRCEGDIARIEIIEDVKPKN